MFCPACGTGLPPSAKFCMKCGTKCPEATPTKENPDLDASAGMKEAMGLFVKGGTLALEKNHEREAFECFDRATQLNPGFKEAWCMRGMTLGWLGRNDDALQSIARAIELDAEYGDAWYNKGVILAEGARRYSEALECFERAQGYGSKQASQAAETCRKALLDARNAGDWIDKSGALGAMGKFQEAIDCCDRAIQIEPGNPIAWSNKGAALGALGRHQESLDCYERVLQLEPGNASAWYSKGATLLNEFHRESEGVACLERAQSLGHPRAGDVLREIRARQKPEAAVSPAARSTPEETPLDMLARKADERGWDPEMKRRMLASVKGHMEESKRSGCVLLILGAAISAAWGTSALLKIGW